MIKKVILREHEYLEFYFEDLGMSQSKYIRLYDLKGCLRCLEPNVNPIIGFCNKCLNERSFNRVISLGIYTAYGSYQKKFGRERWSNLCHYIIYMKPVKPAKTPFCDIKTKETYGQITARLLEWLLHEKRIDLNEYKTIIPIPSYYAENQIDYFGIPLSNILDISYESKSLIRKSPDEKIFEISPNHANLENKSVILLDDVYTAGETKEICSNLLRNIGINYIIILVLARTVEIIWWGNDDIG